MNLSIAQALALSDQLAGVSETPKLDLQLLLCHVLEQPRSYLYTWPERTLSDGQLTCFESALKRRQTGEPIAHITGHRGFWTLQLEVEPSTLIPRPETEQLVELALQLLDDGPHRVADLGTGTGAIALALAEERPAWMVLGVDRVSAAVALAERNRQRLGLDNARILQGDWCEPLPTGLHMILSNPPYIEPEDPHLLQGDLRFEPRSALVADDNGLADIRCIVKQAVAHLLPGGWLLLEHGYDQAGRVRSCLVHEGYEQVVTHRDLAGLDRVTLGQRPTIPPSASPSGAFE
jgi:release factor glutamine methyltransferase